MYRSREAKLAVTSSSNLLQKLKKEPRTYTPVKHPQKDRANARAVLSRLMESYPAPNELLSIRELS